MAQTKISTCLLTLSYLLIGLLTLPAHSRSFPGQVVTKQLQQASKCLISYTRSDVCVLNPAYSFSSDLVRQEHEVAEETADRVYQSIMAQHVLCSQKSSQVECLAGSDTHCFWHHGKQQCQAEKYGSFLLPLTCRGSKAHSFLTCQQKSLAGACKQSSECVADPSGRKLRDQSGQPQHDEEACYPHWLAAEAQHSNSSVQSVAESTALKILEGDSDLLGQCSTTALLQQLVRTCAWNSSWSSCDPTFCNFDVASFIPKRISVNDTDGQAARMALGYEQSTSDPSGQQQRQQQQSKAKLTYFGDFPAPVCFVDGARITTLLHRILSVSPALTEALEEADQSCKSSDDMSFDVATGVGSCGASHFTFDRSDVLKAVKLEQ